MDRIKLFFVALSNQVSDKPIELILVTLLIGFIAGAVAC